MILKVVFNQEIKECIFYVFSPFFLPVSSNEWWSLVEISKLTPIDDFSKLANRPQCTAFSCTVYVLSTNKQWWLIEKETPALWKWHAKTKAFIIVFPFSSICMHNIYGIKVRGNGIGPSEQEVRERKNREGGMDANS